MPQGAVMSDAAHTLSTSEYELRERYAGTSA